MNLKLVTFEIDLTQFLVEAETDEIAVDIAVNANLELGDTREMTEEINDRTQYSVEDVSFDLLGEMFMRTDFAGRYSSGHSEALVFWN